MGRHSRANDELWDFDPDEFENAEEYIHMLRSMLWLIAKLRGGRVFIPDEELDRFISGELRIRESMDDGGVFIEALEAI